MTISEALKSLNLYPITVATIEKICIDRGLLSTDTYTLAIGESEAFQLCTADIYFYLYGHPSLVEQEVGINQAIAIKQGFLAIANKIYALYEDVKFSGFTYGYVGEDLNG